MILSDLVVEVTLFFEILFKFFLIFFLICCVDHNDDDCSPTFHPTYRLRGRGRGRGSRGGRGSRSARGKRRGGGQFNQEKDGVIWSTPDAKVRFFF